MMTISDLNKLGKEKASELLFSCCGSSKWLSLLMNGFPFANETDLVKKAETAWYNQCVEADWLESFTHHPKIGDVKSLAEKFAGKEQESVAAASQDVIESLANLNQEYENKFGFIFIVCATGKSAPEMLRILQDRTSNSREEELHISMGEQHKISMLRFKKLIVDGNWTSIKQSQVTTHVLDTSLGKPGKDITIRLKQHKNGVWQTMAQGITNADGRVSDLLPPGKELMAGNYKIVFETGAYFMAMDTRGFYPEVEITFTVFDGGHYHVPLLINPFGYATYRGS